MYVLYKLMIGTMIFHYLKNLAASHYDMRSSFLCELTGTRFLYKFLVRL